jgi:Fe-Mn family superoxide dismutase
MMAPHQLKEVTMAFELPPLPYAEDALEPHISAETIAYHYGKHHRAYVDNLNKLTAGTAWEEQSLEDIIGDASGAIFNNAAQVWNHTFYWSCLGPGGGGEPTGVLAEKIFGAFGDFEAFHERFTAAASGHFGSGWAWLVQWPDKTLEIVTTGNAGNPLTDGATPLLTCDVWEHAYYIDYRNARPKYLEHFWELVDWDAVARNL